NSASVGFSPDGHFLAVVERAANKIDVFQVLADGRLSPVTVHDSVGPGAFAAAFAPNGTLVVSETGSSTPNSSAISSYAVGPDSSLIPISSSVPTLGAANCWNAFTPNGHFVYASNSGTSNISGFGVSANGQLTAVPGTVVGANPSG